MNKLDPQPITNLGTPYKNIDFNYVGTGTSYAGGFGSNETNREFGITPEWTSNNVKAAAASALSGGGSRKRRYRHKRSSSSSSGMADVSVKAFSKDIKKKMKIISDKYKNMKGKKSLSLKGMKKKFKSMFKTMKNNLKLKGGKKTKGRARTARRGVGRWRGLKRSQKGGYHQFMGNVARSYGYTTPGTALPASELGLANPAPITRYATGVDNYNHFYGKGAQIWN
jgi:hypothetical protein